MTNPKKPRGKGSRGSRKAPPTNAFPVGGPPGPGRPKDDPELIEAFRGRTTKALAVLDKVLDGYLLPPKGKAKPPQAKDAVKAAEVVLDRGWGKAPATIKLAGHDGGPIKGELAAPDVVQSPDRLRRIAAVLMNAGVLTFEDKTETADPVETKEET